MLKYGYGVVYILTFTVTSLNVRGLRNVKKRRAVFDEYRRFSDILILCETHSLATDEKQWTGEWGGKALFSHGTSEAKGICVMFKREFYCNVDHVMTDQMGRYIIADVETISGFKTTLCCIYAPNTDSPAFFDALAQNLTEYHWNKILIGDFNLVMDVNMDRFESQFNPKNARAKLEELREEFNLSDTWRIRFPEKIQFSWRNHSERRASRIDFALLSKQIEPLCENIMYAKGVLTDHSSLFLSIKDIKHERGPGYWKCNTSLLNDEEYVNTVKNELSAFINRIKGNETAIKTWTMIKEKMAQLLKKNSRKKAEEKKLVIAQLNEAITAFEEKFPLTRCELRMYSDSKMDLEKLLMERAKALIFRSKVRWYEEGERSTRYFLSLEKVRSAVKSCSLLINSAGQELVEHEQIMAKQVKFYTELLQIGPLHKVYI